MKATLEVGVRKLVSENGYINGISVNEFGLCSISYDKFDAYANVSAIASVPRMSISNVDFYFRNTNKYEKIKIYACLATKCSLYGTEKYESKQFGACHCQYNDLAFDMSCVACKQAIKREGVLTGIMSGSSDIFDVSSLFSPSSFLSYSSKPTHSNPKIIAGSKPELEKRLIMGASLLDGLGCDVDFDTNEKGEPDFHSPVLVTVDKMNKKLWNGRIINKRT